MSKVRSRFNNIPMKDVYTVSVHTSYRIYLLEDEYDQKILEVSFSSESQARLFYGLCITFHNLLNSKIVSKYQDLLLDEVKPLFLESPSYEFVFPSELRKDKEKLKSYLEQNPKDVFIKDWLTFWPIHYEDGELYKIRQVTIEYYDPNGKTRLIENFLPMYIHY